MTETETKPDTYPKSDTAMAGPAQPPPQQSGQSGEKSGETGESRFAIILSWAELVAGALIILSTLVRFVSGQYLVGLSYRTWLGVAVR